MSEHNPNAWQDGFDAWQNGYDDAMYDGIDTSSEMPCKCEACLKAYDEGQQEAIKEIFGRGQSAQQTLALDASPQAVVKKVRDMGEVNGVKLTYVNGNVFATPSKRR